MPEFIEVKGDFRKIEAAIAALKYISNYLKTSPNYSKEVCDDITKRMEELNSILINSQNDIQN